LKRLALLAVIAVAPVVCLYACKTSETPSPADASVARDPVVAASSSSAGISAPPTPVTVAASASASSSSSATPSKKQLCEALQQKVTSLLATGRGCVTTADCDNVMTGCGLDGQCGAPIAKGRKPAVEKTSQLFFSKSCLDVLPPQPCATCAMPAPPKCVNGQCN